ncbi:DMT family transporter [Fervidibacillus halotolerans]|uniref:Multidrug efflux SMR transporter n=1 Tax=Fervidibacillus halotolerans TaxID=2980027 RepID=A0A9E8RXW5_9BACI|nr:multidrug efflux SMR transporter [Fervidibacillus halotolerans]WAA13185.1 multidrug efflux SMR transporter [Fervidibacillus halotolerans]
MAWIALILAGLFESFGVAMMNQVQKTKNFFTIFLLISSFGTSFFLLGYALRFLPMGTAYAIWTGIGVVGGTIFGMIFYGESKDGIRIFLIGIILSSVIGLKLLS